MGGTLATTTGWLTQQIVQSWDHLSTELTDLRICWTDDLGTHVTGSAGVPATQPATCTHLWGWSDSRLLRARIDGTQIWLAVLHLVETPDAVSVTCRIEDGLRWRSPEAESAMFKLAPDTGPEIFGAHASSFFVIDGPRLVFLKM